MYTMFTVTLFFSISPLSPLFYSGHRRTDLDGLTALAAALETSELEIVVCVCVCGVVPPKCENVKVVFYTDEK